jgi:predicted small lipoprotein YifL
MKKTLIFNSALILTVVILIFSLTSCDQKSPGGEIPPCEQPPNVIQDLFPFTIRDKNNPQIAIVGGLFSQYNTDSIQLINEDLLVNNSFKMINNGLYFNFISFPKDSVAYQNKISKRYFLVLSESDVDTIQAEFKLDYVEKCFVTQFESLKVYYNDSLYYDNNKTDGYPYLTFFK